jgi:hypothetical protein
LYGRVDSGHLCLWETLEFRLASPQGDAAPLLPNTVMTFRVISEEEKPGLSDRVDSTNIYPQVLGLTLPDIGVKMGQTQRTPELTLQLTQE